MLLKTLALPISLALTMFMLSMDAKLAFGQNASATIRALRRFDTNGDGRLDAAEVPSQAWANVQRIAAQAGMNTSGGLALDQLERRAAGGRDDGDDRRSWGGRGGRDGGDGGQRWSGRDRGGRGEDEGRGGDWRERFRRMREEGGGGPGGGDWRERFGRGGEDGGRGPWGRRGAEGERPGEGEQAEAVEATTGPQDFGLPEESASVLGFGAEADETPTSGSGTNAPPASESPREDRRRGRGGDRDREGGDSERGGRGSRGGWGGWGSGGGENDEDRFKRFAEGMIRRFDQNGDNVLDKEEASQLRGPMADADANKDGKVTQDELAEKLAGFSRDRQQGGNRGGDQGERGGRGGWGGWGRGGGDRTADDRGSERGGGNRGGWGRGGGQEGWSRDRGGNSEGGRGGRRGRGGEDTSSSQQARSYRFLSPEERIRELLPGRLQEDFLDMDSDKDGQVAMAEFTDSWNDRVIREFSTYDANRDGYITPQEFLASEQGDE